MITEPISFKEAESMIDGRMDQATAMKYKDILAGWSQDARQRAFFSARVADATLLSEIHRRVSAVVNGSMTSKQAVRLLRESLAGPNADALAALGFAPKEEARGMAELASVPRLRLIIEQNARMAQECGHYQQWEAVKDYYPIGVWHCGYAEVHRQEHLARDGKAYEFDHPIWTQSPPGGEFNCHCWRENMTRDGATAKGLVPEPNTSFFQPSSLGFDPSQPFDASSVVPGKSVLPEFVQKAKDSECPDDVLEDMVYANAPTDNSPDKRKKDARYEKARMIESEGGRPVSGEISRKQTRKRLNPILEKGAMETPDDHKASEIHDGDNVLAEFRNGVIRSIITEEIETETDFLSVKGVRHIRAIAKHPSEEYLAGMTSSDNVLLLNEKKLTYELGVKTINTFAGRDFYLEENRIRNTIKHEFGHLLYNAISDLDSLQGNLFKKDVEKWYNEDIEADAILTGETNEREWFAENYAFWRMGSTELMSKKHGSELTVLFQEISALFHKKNKEKLR